MPRALTMRQSSVPAGEREQFHAAARQTLAHYAAEGCNYWVFEAREHGGDYVEFFEGPDPEILMRAHRRAGEAGAAAAPLYVHVELN